MALSNKTILNLLDALQDNFGPFVIFEDVSPLVLEAENASELPLATGPTGNQDVAA